MITTLIDKQDTFEIVRDQIAAILALEVANQQALAIAASKDPEPWDLKIFTERANPWEQALNTDAQVTPIVNVWYDNSSFEGRASNISERQATVGIFNIDCYGFAVSQADGAGHKPGDQEAAFEVQRAVRLVRNILMAATYTYLDLRGTVGRRWPLSITSFQPKLDVRTVQRVVGARIALQVQFNEFSPQVEGEVLETVSITFERAEDGEILIEAQYP